jgi:hypothetical protein
MERYQKLLEFMQGLEPDVVKFYEKGQAAAGTRLRKGLSELKKIAQEFRNEVQNIKSERKTPKA